MRDGTEAAVRALPVHLQRRMAHLVLRGWKIESGTLCFDTNSAPTTWWTARYTTAADNDPRHAIYTFKIYDAYALKIYSSSTLPALLDQMARVVKDMQSCEFQERYGALL